VGIGWGTDVFGQTTASWLRNSSSWTTTSLWSIAPAYPNNDPSPGGQTYSAFINVPTNNDYYVSLATEITIDNITLDSPNVLFLAGGTLNLNGTLNINDGTVRFRGRVNGGTIQGSPEGNARVEQNEKATFDGVTIKSDLDLYGQLTLRNPKPMQGTTINVFSSLTVPDALTGDGTILLRGGGYHAASVAPMTTIYATEGSSSIVSAGSNAGSLGILNRGRIVASSAGTNLSIFGGNEGAITAQSGSTIDWIGAGNYANEGTVIAITGGQISVPFVRNFSAGVLTGGSYAVYQDSTITFGSAITTNDANITLSGSQSRLDAVDSLGINRGAFTLANGRSFTTVGSLTNSGTITVGEGSALTINGELANTGTIDTAGTVTMDYALGALSPIDTVRSQLRSGFNHAAWDGAGILSSAARTDPRKSLGYLDDTLGTAVQIKLTVGGDTNLDGIVDLSDVGALALNWNNLGYWANGDFNYDHLVNVADLKILANNWQSGTAAPTVSLDALLISFGLPLVEVPEPTTAGIIAGTVGWAALSRRRFKKGERRA
jgi:hypothetical protein